jgi:hypothetical protein
VLTPFKHADIGLWILISNLLARHWRLMPVIPATQRTEIRRIMVQSQPRQIVHKSLFENI